MKSPVAHFGGPPVVDVLWSCANGVSLAAQLYRTPPPTITASNATAPRKLLCLHGWMDNGRSFHHLAPALCQSNQDPSFEVLTLDLPGHGGSEHTPEPPAVLAEAVYYVAEAVRLWGAFEEHSGDAETEPRITLIGHSMGAAISCLYAAAFPEQVQALVLLDGAGPLARPAHDFPQQVRRSVQFRQKRFLATSEKPPRIYPSLAQAVAVRQQTAQSHPGAQYLSREAATELVLRGTRPVHTETNTTENNENADDAATRGWQFRHDPRLTWPSLQYTTPEQVAAIYAAIQCPVALLRAQDGWPLEKEQQERMLELLQPTLFRTLPGSHHFHADPDTADAVVAAVQEFLLLTNPPPPLQKKE